MQTIGSTVSECSVEMAIRLFMNNQKTNHSQKSSIMGAHESKYYEEVITISDDEDDVSPPPFESESESYESSDDSIEVITIDSDEDEDQEDCDSGIQSAVEAPRPAYLKRKFLNSLEHDNYLIEKRQKLDAAHTEEFLIPGWLIDVESHEECEGAPEVQENLSVEDEFSAYYRRTGMVMPLLDFWEANIE